MTAPHLPDAERWEQIEQVFVAALNTADPDQRKAVLDAGCADDPELRREVEGLLAASRGANPFLRSIAHGAGLPFGDREEAQGVEGRLLGAYRLIREIGRGGMGLVYLAERADGRFEMNVAIKVLPLGMGNHAHRSRFRAERRILAQLDHPGIARLVDAGVTRDALPYFVMEYVEGEPITRYCDRTDCTIEQRLDLFGQVCDAVGYAHRKRLVHRDLKPSNILVDSAGRVKLLDFGIAKLLDGDAAADSTLTRWGGNPVTPAFASPEQMAGGPITLASDVYQLGALLYLLLAGRAPISLTGKPYQEIMQRLAEREPTPPSAAGEAAAPGGDPDGRPRLLARLRRVRPPGTRSRSDLDAIVLKALRKQPERRYASADELAADLRRFRGGEPVLVRRDGWRNRLRHGHFRRPVAVGTAALGLLLVIVMVTAVLTRVGWDPGLPAGAEGTEAGSTGGATVAVLPFDVRGDASLHYLGEGLASLLAGSVDGVGGIRSVDSRTLMNTMARAGTATLDRDDADGVAARFGAVAYLTGDVVAVGGRLRVSAQLRDLRGTGQDHFLVIEGSEPEIFELSERLAGWVIGRLAPGRHARTAAASTGSLAALQSYVAGEAAYRRGDYEAAVHAFTSAVEADTAFALANYRLSVALEWIGGEGRAAPYAARAARHSARLPTRDRLLVEGHFAYRSLDFDTAERVYRRLVARYPETEEGWYGLAEITYHRGPARGGPMTEAREAFEAVLRLDPDHLPALLHRARIAAAERDTHQLNALVRRYVQSAPAGERAVELRAIQALMTRDDLARRQVMAELQTEASPRLWMTAWRAVVYSGELEAGSELVRLLLHSSRPLNHRANAHLMLAHIELARGRPARAAAELDLADGLIPGTALLVRGLFATVPFVATGAPELRDLRTRLEDRPADAPWPQGQSILAADAAARPYLLGLLDLALGDVEQARARVEVLEAMDPRAAPTATGSAAALLARIALGSSSPNEALAIASAHGERVGLPYSSGGSPFYSQLDARFLRAQLLDRAGRHDDALLWYDSFVEDHPFGVIYVAPAHARAATLHADAGRMEEAARHYAAFIRLWRDAEPDLQPLVRDAERQLAALPSLPE